MPNIITKNNIDDCQRWTLPIVGNKPSTKVMTNRLSQQDQELLAELKQQAIEEGKREGYAQGEQQVNDCISQLKNLLNLLAQPMQLIDSEIENQLVQLVKVIVKQCLCKELSLAPKLILGAVKESMLLLPALTSEYTLYLSEKDRQALTDSCRAHELPLTASQIMADDSLLMGEFRLVAPQGKIDTTIENHIQKALEQMSESE